MEKKNLARLSGNDLGVVTVGDHYFLLGSVKCKFSVDDVEDILQIPKGEKELVEVKNYKPTSQLEKYSKERRVKKLDIEKELK